MKTLRVQPLTAAAMAPFGSVIDGAPGGAAVNGGSSLRHEAVAALDLQRDGGRAVLAVYAALARAFPFEARVLERHRLSDQVFLPLGGARRCVLLLAPAALEHPGADDCVALLSNGQQGVRIAAGTWHHGLLALDDGPWAVLERRAAAMDNDERTLDAPIRLDL
jgi:ureidoglycolate lyase